MDLTHLSLSVQLNPAPPEVNGNHNIDFRWASEHAKLVLWELGGTSNYRALSHKYTFTNTQIRVPLWKQPSSCGKETFPYNFHSPRSDQEKVSCCHNLLHLVRIANYQDRFCDVSSSCPSPNQKLSSHYLPYSGQTNFAIQTYVSN